MPHQSHGSYENGCIGGYKPRPVYRLSWAYAHQPSTCAMSDELLETCKRVVDLHVWGVLYVLPERLDEALEDLCANRIV